MHIYDSGQRVRYLWDLDKARKNEEKHGVTFQEAAEILGMECTRIPAKTKGEPRYLAIARIRGEYLSVVYTQRDGALRIISARHSTREERAIYERDHG